MIMPSFINYRIVFSFCSLIVLVKRCRHVNIIILYKKTRLRCPANLFFFPLATNFFRNANLI